MLEGKGDESLLGKFFKPSASMLGSVAPPGTSVAGERKESLREAILDATFGVGRYISKGVTTDWYGGDQKEPVSFQEAAEGEKDLKDALDDAVDDENRYSSSPGRVKGEQDAPCRVLRRRNRA